MKAQVITSIHNGKFKRNLNTVLDIVKQFNGMDVLLTFEKPKKKRSNRQNNFYWGVCIPLIQNGLKESTGEFRSAKDVHYKILLPLFAPTSEIINTETGECISEKISSSEMTTTQFLEYIMEIQKWAIEFLGIDIPNPNEIIKINFE
jgi:hypothetical protein